QACIGAFPQRPLRGTEKMRSLIAMDQNAPREDLSKAPPRLAPMPAQKPARAALGVLALCFALSVLGRGLGESFTVFLKPISENFGWDRSRGVSVYLLILLGGGPRGGRGG